jgi:hypothetical protein
MQRSLHAIFRAGYGKYYAGFRRDSTLQTWRQTGVKIPSSPLTKSLAPPWDTLCNDTSGPPDRSYGFFENRFFPLSGVRSDMADNISLGKKPGCLQKPANDNQSPPGGMLAIVTIPKDSPVLQAEIEVFALLLDDWGGIAANDNEDVPK